MNLRRILANAIARRVAYVLVAVVLAWVGLGDARAAECGIPSKSEALAAAGRGEVYAYEYEARAACESVQGWHSTQSGGIVHRLAKSAACEPVAGNEWRARVSSQAAGGERFDVLDGCAPLTPNVFGSDSATGWKWINPGCPAGGTWNPETNSCGSCSDKPYLGAGAWSNVQGGKMCKDSCEYEGGTSPGGGVGVCFDMVVDGQSYTYCSGWGPTGSQCTVDGPGGFPGTPSEAPPDSDGDGTSDDFDSAPNNPGRGGSGPDGEPTQEDGDCGGIGQPECGALGSGSGNGNTSGGGGDCNTPPSSTGDPILAQIAFQTWATRCAVEGNANAGPGSGSGDGGEGLLDQLRAEAAGLDQSLGEGDADAAWIEGPTTLDLDTGGLGIGGTCPAPPTVNGVSIDPDGNLCMLVQIIGALVLVGAYVHAGYIIGRA